MSCSRTSIDLNTGQCASHENRAFKATDIMTAGGRRASATTTTTNDDEGGRALASSRADHSTTRSNNQHQHQNHHQHQHHHYHKRPVQAGAALTILALALITQTMSPIVGADSPKDRPTNGTSLTNSTTVLASSGQLRRAIAHASDSATKGATTKSSLAADRQQATADLSSVYVQIPIAEPIEASASSGSATLAAESGQQQHTDEGADSPAADSTKATTWTGPWPKKFQIGYIKQSDLHQVLIESLKNDPYLGSKKAGGQQQAAPATTKASPSPLSVTGSGGKGAESPAAQTTQEPSAGTKLPAESGPPQAPPSDASSLMQPTGGSVYQAKLKAPAPAGRLQQQHHHHQQQQQQQHQHQHQPHQQSARHYLNSQWPAGNSYGHLASPQVQPRPSTSMGFLGKGNLLYQPASGMPHPHQHQRPHQFHHHNQQQPQGAPMSAGHHAGLNHQQRSNHFRHSTAAVINQHHVRQPRNHPQQQQPQPFGSPQMAGQQGFKYGPPAGMTQQQQMLAAPFQQQAGLAVPAMHAQQPHQLQFAGNPSFTSQQQPVYSINNFPVSQPQQQQQTVDGDSQMELIQLSNSGGQAGRPKSKSEYYASSWRPVQSDNTDDAKLLQQQQLAAGELGVDGFDDEFGSPATGGAGAQQQSTSSMNRHPVLSNYLQGGSTPADAGTKAPKQQPQAPTKGGSAAAGPSKGAGPQATKSAAGGGFDASSVQERLEGTKSDAGRRTLGPAGDNATSTSTPTSLDGSSPTTTSSSSSTSSSTTTQQTPTSTGSDETSTSAGQTTTSAPTTTTTLATSTNQTTSATSQGVETTTDPDSEVFESDTTEPSSDEEPTTTSPPMSAGSGGSSTASSMQASSGRSTTPPSPTLRAPTSSSPAPTVQQSSASDGGESEVVTQGQGSAAASGGTFPAVPQSGDADESSTPVSVQSATMSTTTGSSREETTPAGGGAEIEGAPERSATASPDSGSPAQAAKTDASMSDEALMAVAVRASEVAKSRPAGAVQKGAQSQTSGGSSSSTKKARNSERIVQAPAAKKPTQQQQQATSSSNNNNNNNKLITRKPTTSKQRAGKQISGVKGGGPSPTAPAVKGGTLARGAKKAAQKSLAAPAATKKKSSTGNGAKSAKLATTPNKGNKFTRMAPGGAAAAAGQQSSSGQLVSMSAAQAQSAAQTLASLLLSRCLSSNNCSHLLDVCSTKQAAVPFGPNASSSASAGTPSPTSSNSSDVSSSANASIAAAWSMPVGLVSSNLMGLMQALQADKALQLFPAWRDAIEGIMDQETQTGYTLIMPSNEAIDRMALAQVDSLLANADQMNQLIENHILDSAETIELAGQTRAQSTASLAALRQRHQTRYIKPKGLQINQHRDRMATINGKRVVYANQLVPGE
jgi:hypothetical protein